MLEFDLIKKLSKSRGFTLKDVILKAEMSEPTFYNCVKRGSIETKNLQKIAEVLNVPVSYFFGEDANVNSKNNNTVTNTVQDLEKENKQLHKELLDCQKKIIELLEKRE